MSKDFFRDVLCYPANFIYGKDCSEYAEDLIAALGYGEIYTYERPKHLNFFGTVDTFMYHTVVLCGNFIGDLTSPDKCYHKMDYDRMMGSTGHKGYTTYR